MGVMKSSRNPNAAKLLINFLLSDEGQRAMAVGGTPVYWPGIEKAGNLPTLAGLLAEGTNSRKIAHVAYETDMDSKRDDFTSRMRKALGQ